MFKILSVTFLLFIAGETAFAQPKKVTIGEVREIRSNVLSEKRTLNIYLPPGYNDTTKYPVIYLLDGGVDEDFIHVVGLVQFNTQPWVARMPASIVVGVTNVDRKRDFTFPTTVKGDKQKYPTTGGSEKFIAFLEKELQPFINKHYRTNGTSTLVGESLGGLLATQVFAEKPQLFDKYVIVSPSLWWDNGSILKRKFINQPAKKTNVYLAVGKEGLAPSEEPHVMEVDANVLLEKINALHDPNVSVYFDYLPEETHATIEHQALMNAFKRVYRQS